MTKHSIIRTTQRTHLGESSSIKMIMRARERGLDSSDFPSRERKYLESKEIGGKHALYYTGYCFIFDYDFRCITMFPVPEWFNKKRFYQGKQIIRQPKKYIRNNPNYYENQETFCFI